MEFYHYNFQGSQKSRYSLHMMRYYAIIVLPFFDICHASSTFGASDVRQEQQQMCSMNALNINVYCILYTFAMQIFLKQTCLGTDQNVSVVSRIFFWIFRLFLGINLFFGIPKDVFTCSRYFVCICRVAVSLQMFFQSFQNQILDTFICSYVKKIIKFLCVLFNKKTTFIALQTTQFEWCLDFRDISSLPHWLMAKIQLSKYCLIGSWPKFSCQNIGRPRLRQSFSLV